MAENCGDDDLRLVFSDWLEENGNTLRADLIRAQVELSKIPNEDPRYLPLLDKERDLWIRWTLLELGIRDNPFKQPPSEYEGQA